MFRDLPSYEIELRGDGRVVYTGRSFVLIRGRHESRERNPSPTPLEAAVSSGKPRLVRALIAKGAFHPSPHASDALLMAATASGNLETVAEILKLKPNVNAVDDEGNTALILISRSRYRQEDGVNTEPGEITSLLLAAGADPKIRGEFGFTALHLAQDERSVRLLLAAGADLEAKSEDGDTPILTAETDSAAIAMIKSGADIKAVSKDGRTALKNADNLGLKGAASLLRARGAK